ncbi:MAG: M23 family metallopeptidase [Micropruina sp.]|nr:M23 family metallopeptidase [Micropruina sp.]
MIAANLLFFALAITLVVLAVRGLGGAWPMQLASFAALALWVITAVWAGLNLFGELSSINADGATRSLVTFQLIVAPVTGLGLAFIAFIKCGPAAVPRLFHALGLTAFLVVLVATFAFGKDSALVSKIVALIIGVLWLALWLIFYVLLSGSVDTAAYASARSDLKLPFPAGERTWVMQGNNSHLNHNHANLAQDFAWDFRRPCGTPVLAALDGTVTSVIDSNDGIGGSNNEIEIQHADGSVASYLHILHNSATVLVGGRVVQGDPLASVGSVGNSLTGHIHFEVRVGADTVPVTFVDVTRHDGIPRGFRFYTSGNA